MLPSSVFQAKRHLSSQSTFTCMSVTSASSSSQAPSSRYFKNIQKKQLTSYSSKITCKDIIPRLFINNVVLASTSSWTETYFRYAPCIPKYKTYMKRCVCSYTSYKISSNFFLNAFYIFSQMIILNNKQIRELGWV